MRMTDMGLNSHRPSEADRPVSMSDVSDPKARALRPGPLPPLRRACQSVPPRGELVLFPSPRC